MKYSLAFALGMMGAGAGLIIAFPWHGWGVGWAFGVIGLYGLSVVARDWRRARQMLKRKMLIYKRKEKGKGELGTAGIIGVICVVVGIIYVAVRYGNLSVLLAKWVVASIWKITGLPLPAFFD